MFAYSEKNCKGEAMPILKPVRSVGSCFASSASLNYQSNKAIHKRSLDEKKPQISYQDYYPNNETQYTLRFLNDYDTGIAPNLSLDTNNLTGPVDFYQTGFGGRTESMQATIRLSDLNTGTSPNQKSRNYIHGLTDFNDDA